MSSTVIIIVVDKQIDKEEQEKEVKRRLSRLLWTEFQIRDIEELHGKSFISVICKRLHPVCAD